jgi:NAD-dependent dihydropyrimidine dehydrogenase PreA subunit
MSTVPTAVRVVLYEGSGAQNLESTERFEITRALLEKGFAVVRARPGESVDSPVEGELLVLGRFDSATPSDDAAGNAAPLRFRNIDGQSAAQVVEMVEQVREQAQGPRPPAWKPWFPVIDYDRCTNCMQCLSFCLFDVYGVREGKIQVRNQSNCKTDCPACSRVCPEVAILFPKYRSGPINGDEIDPEDLRRESMKVDISALLGGDIYQALRDRSAHAKSRFSKERDEDRALKERQRCLVKLQQQMDIPPEVLASLPSPDEIRKRAEQAQARAAEALQTATVEGNAG